MSRLALFLALALFHILALFLFYFPPPFLRAIICETCVSLQGTLGLMMARAELSSARLCGAHHASATFDHGSASFERMRILLCDMLGYDIQITDFTTDFTTLWQGMCLLMMPGLSFRVCCCSIC